MSSAYLKQRRANLKMKFGMTLEQYDEMLEAQNGVCAICRQNCIAVDKLAVDHCHQSGKIRGLLCLRCNMGLGLVHDSEEKLKALAKYLEEHS